jgi:hypothetical protein
MIASGLNPPAFVRMWFTHDVPKLLDASAESSVVAARLRKCQVSIRPTDPVKVIAVVLPETDRADVVRAALGKGALTATRTGEPLLPPSACSTHTAMIAPYDRMEICNRTGTGRCDTADSDVLNCRRQRTA